MKKKMPQSPDFNSYLSLKSIFLFFLFPSHFLPFDVWKGIKCSFVSTWKIKIDLSVIFFFFSLDAAQ